jgi:hypothetical protein
MCFTACGAAGDERIPLSEPNGSNEPAAVAGADPGGTEPTGAPLEQVMLAAFDLPNGTHVEFVSIPEIAAVGYAEVMGVGVPSPFEGRALSLLERFLELAPKDAPVPRVLVTAPDAEGTRHLAEGRVLAETVEGMSKGRSTGSLGEVATPRLRPLWSNNTYGTWDCGDGSSTFAEKHCRALTSDPWYCDSGQWHHLDRASGDEKRQDSDAVTAACGTSATTEHYYWNGSSWRNVYNAPVTSHGRYTKSSWLSLTKWKRRVSRARSGGEGYFRAYTSFTN